MDRLQCRPECSLRSHRITPDAETLDIAHLSLVSSGLLAYIYDCLYGFVPLRTAVTKVPPKEK